MDAADESEEVDGILILPGDHEASEEVIRGERPGRPARLASAPIGQTAAVAAGGFMAGAAVVGVLSLRRRNGSPSRRRGGRRGSGGRTRAVGELVQIIGTRSLLVDVHLLDGSGRR